MLVEGRKPVPVATSANACPSDGDSTSSTAWHCAQIRQTSAGADHGSQALSVSTRGLAGAEETGQDRNGQAPLFGADD